MAIVELDRDHREEQVDRGEHQGSIGMRGVRRLSSCCLVSRALRMGSMLALPLRGL